MKIGKGDTVLITGGGSGIGRGLAETFHRHGAKVIICGRTADKIDRVASAHSGMVAEVADVSDPASIQALSARIASQFPNLSVLVNNAGIQRLIDFSQDSTNIAELTDEIEINFSGMVLTTAAFLPLLRRAPQTRTIIQIGSGLGLVPLVKAPVYSATKAAVHSFSTSLREQLRPAKIRVVEIIPPVVETDLHQGQAGRPPNSLTMDVFLRETMAGLAADRDEIPVGQVKKLRWGVRIAPSLFLKIINRV